MSPGEAIPSSEVFDMSTLNERGHEVFSGERRALPIHIGQRSPSIHERIRSMILAMKSAEREGYETFEDADDFDVGDDSPDKIEQLPNYQRYEYEKDSKSSQMRRRGTYQW